MDLSDYPYMGSTEENICTDCENSLIVSYNFKKKCLDNNEVLNELYSKNNLHINLKELRNWDYISLKEVREIQQENDQNIIFEKPLSDMEEDIINESEININKNKFFDSILDIQHETTNEEIIITETVSKENTAVKKVRKNYPRQPVLCYICGKIVSGRFYSVHLRKHIDPEYKYKYETFNCKICGKNIKGQSNILHHIRLHNKIKNFKCRYCDEKFLHWSQKRAHTRMVHKIGTTFCNICNKELIHQSLSTHMKINHSEEPRFSCKICERPFKRLQSLNNHILTIHKKERTEICALCGKGFNTKIGLRRHLHTHNGIKRYGCPFCDKKATQNNVIRCHIKIHHPEMEAPPIGTSYIINQ